MPDSHGLITDGSGGGESHGSGPSTTSTSTASQSSPFSADVESMTRQWLAETRVEPEDIVVFGTLALVAIELYRLRAEVA